MASSLHHGSTNDSQPIGDVLLWKKTVTRAQKLFEATAQVPSPSKDFCQILVTERGVVWRKWKITLRNSQGPPPTPTENIMSYEDFKYDKSLQSEIEYIFGVHVLKQIKRILQGCNDHLSSLPESLMITVALYLDLQSIIHLSQVNQYFQEICNSNLLWEKLYIIHQGQPSLEIKSLAQELTWKRVFFMNKLQLQKEISRRRRLQTSPVQGDKGTESKEFSSTFLTQQIKD